MNDSVYKVNVSAINQFSRCRFRWWAQFVMNQVPREEAKPLAFGRLLHLVFEEHAKGVMSMQQAIDKWQVEWHNLAMQSTDSFERTVRLEALGQLGELEEALGQWKDAYEFETPVLEAEQPFELAHPKDDSIILVGRPDRCAVMAGKIWHVQNRGLAASINFGIYTELAKRAYHEHTYAEALTRKYPEYPYGGTVFNLVRKLKYRTKITKKNPEGKKKELSEMFFQFPMSIDLKSPLHEHVMDCVLDYAYQMRTAEKEWRDHRTIPSPNESENGGMYHNKPDVFFRVLTGDIELSDPQYFKKRIDPYQETTNETD